MKPSQQKKKQQQGLKFDGMQKNGEVKPRWDLMLEQEIEEIIKVLTKGADKYEDYNWEKVKPFFNRYFSATMRHLKARKAGEVTDEDGESHLAHAATNILFLMNGDNNKIDIREKNIAIDIDEVLADYANHHIKHKKTNKNPINRNSYGLYYGFDDDFKKSLTDKEFWLSIPKLTDPKEIWFEPKCYITARLIPKEWTEEWLSSNGFPIRPVIYTENKGQACIDNSVDIMIDDVFTHFINITNAGIKCFLFDRPHNQNFNVGKLRIKSLKEIT